MAPRQRANHEKNGRKVRGKRKGYQIRIKTFARQMRKDKLSNAEIKKKIKEMYNMDVPDSTLSTWWNTRNMQIVANMAEDRLNVDDKRINPSQRPDVIVDMESILLRKVRCVKLKGIPYTREMIQILAIHIFQKLISFNLYNAKGQRKDPGQVIDDRIINSVQQCKLVTKYLAKSSKKTEFHKSTDAVRNDQVSPLKYPCNMCERKFKCQINITLHIYWHTVKERQCC